MVSIAPKSITRFSVCLGAFLAVSATIAQAGTVTTFTDRSAFGTAVGATTTDDFGTTPAFPIATGVLDSTTNGATPFGGPILPGTVQPGVTYSTPVGTGNFFNIDSGAGFSGAFLDGFQSNLTVTFASPVAAFGFDSKGFRMTAATVMINFSSDPSVTETPLISFNGYQSNAADITSVVIGTGSGFAIDNFSVTSVSGAPEPGTFLLGGTLLAGMLGLSRRNSKS
jgi:hypothetical protein